LSGRQVHGGGPSGKFVDVPTGGPETVSRQAWDRAVTPRVLGRVSLDGGQVHSLLESGDSYRHLWTGPDGEEVSSIPGTDLLEMLAPLMACFLHGSGHQGDGEARLRFNAFGRYSGGEASDLGLDRLEGVSILREDGVLSIRAESGGGRFKIDVYTGPERGRFGDFLLSRLCTMGCNNVPELMGISYWEAGGGPLIWSRLTRHDRSSSPGLRPFLSDLDDLIGRLAALDGTGYSIGMNELSRGEGTSMLGPVKELGGAIARTQSMLVIEDGTDRSSSGKVGDRILDQISVSRMTMIDAGSLMGRMSNYLSGLKRELLRLTGEEPLPVAGSRKQKVVRSSPRLDSLRTRGLEAIPLFERRLGPTIRQVRSGSSSIKKLVGSPQITSMMDMRLERMEIDGEGRFQVCDFDWHLHGDDRDKPLKTSPLKDLALVLNSLMRARYLSSRKAVMRSAPRLRSDGRMMWTMSASSKRF